MTKPKKRGPRHYTVEFKQEAVALMQRQRQAGRPLAAIARDLGVSAQLLRYWEVGRSGSGSPPPDPLPTDVEPLQLEVKRLRRELERVEEERDFLKKAAAFFAKESP